MHTITCSYIYTNMHKYIYNIYAYVQRPSIIYNGPIQSARVSPCTCAVRLWMSMYKYEFVLQVRFVRICLCI